MDSRMNKVRIMNLPTAYNRFMHRFSHLISLGFALSGLAACGAAPIPAPPTAANPSAPHEVLGTIVDRYWDEHASFGTVISPQAMADSLALERRYLAQISALPRAPLTPQARLTYDIFKRRRELDVEGFTYPGELLAVDPFAGMPQQLARMAAETDKAPSMGGADFRNWQHRIDEYASWTTQAIINMREGIRRGYITPRAVIERSLPPLQAWGSDSATNVFYRHLGADLSGAIKNTLLPSYREMHDFLQREYLPHARSGVALSALPLGKPWYAYRVRLQTSSALVPGEIHAIGLREVDRIRALMQSLPLATPPQAGTSPSTYGDLKVQVLAAMPTLFSTLPPTDVDIRTVESWGMGVAPLYYVAAASGSGLAAALYVTHDGESTRSSNVSTASFLRQDIPGLYYQASLQDARKDLPKFRRFGTDPAFVQGWGLYAVSLGEEMGLYLDQGARSDALQEQLNCAAALVVDTGLHALGWTRTQALDYLRTRVGSEESEANLMIDRFVAAPADALACKIGELKIQALRSRAQQLLGTRFDIREFHAELLNDGAMPLDILETKMNLWMDALR
jgi:uncharacterized protein (DUF885 family)